MMIVTSGLAAWSVLASVSSAFWKRRAWAAKGASPWKRRLDLGRRAGPSLPRTSAPGHWADTPARECADRPGRRSPTSRPGYSAWACAKCPARARFLPSLSLPSRSRKLDFQTTKGLPSTDMTSASQAQIGGGVWNIDPNHSLIEFSANTSTSPMSKAASSPSRARSKSTSRTCSSRRSSLTIDASSLDSQAVQMREDLIKGEEMLEVAKYPTITFKSTRIASRDASHYDVTGDLTMRGVTKSITIPIEFGGLVTTRMGPRAWVSLPALTLNKSNDFQVPVRSPNSSPGRFVIADEIAGGVRIEVDARAILKKAGFSRVGGARRPPAPVDASRPRKRSPRQPFRGDPPLVVRGADRPQPGSIPIRSSLQLAADGRAPCRQREGRSTRPRIPPPRNAAPATTRRAEIDPSRSANSRPDHAAGGRRGKECAASLRAEQRLAAGAAALPTGRVDHVTASAGCSSPTGSQIT